MYGSSQTYIYPTPTDPTPTKQSKPEAYGWLVWKPRKTAWNVTYLKLSLTLFSKPLVDNRVTWRDRMTVIRLKIRTKSHN